MAGEQDVIQLPFKVTEINEDMLVALHRNFKEIERHLSFLQMQIKFATGGGVANLKDSAKVWDRAKNITETGTFLTEKLEGLIEELQIADAAISELKLKDLAVNSAKLAENAVITEKIADGAVDTDKLAANAVVAEKINANAVTSEKIHAGAVTTEKIGAKAVTAEKINVESLSAISSNIGHITAGQIDAGVVRIGPQTTFAPGYDPTQIVAGSTVGMGVDADCVGLWHFDGSLNSHKGVAAIGDANFDTGCFGQAVKVEEGTTNLADSSAFTVYPGAVATRSVQVGGPYDGWYRVDATVANSDNGYIAYNTSAPLVAHGETRTLSLEFVSESGNITPFMDGSEAVGALALVPGTNRWVKTWTNTLGAPKSEGVYFKSATGGPISETFYYRFYMHEAKPYATSFVDGTRLGVLKAPTTGLSASQGSISFRAKNLAESANGSVLVDLPDSTNTEGLRVGISGDGKIYVEKIMDWVEEPDDFSQTETDFSTGTLNQVWQVEGGLQLADTMIRTWNDFTGTSWNDLA